MSIETLTGDEFMNLSPEDHRTALFLYEDAVDATTREVTKLAGGPRTNALDRLTSLLQLRKLHRVRLAELEEDESQQYAVQIVQPLAPAEA